MTAPIYLAEVRYDPGDSPELRLFTAGQLTAWLARNIEHDHYSGDACELMRLFRYDSGGALTRLTVHPTGENRDSGDWLYWDYEVCAADALHSDGGHVAEVAFTVRIDGRA